MKKKWKNYSVLLDGITIYTLLAYGYENEIHFHVSNFIAFLITVANIYCHHTFIVSFEFLYNKLSLRF